jgi:hypothetical protein
MSGKWGVGYRIHATPQYWNSYNVGAFIEQLKTIRGNPSWVIVNLSGPAHGGDVYLSHNPLLWSLGNTSATPGPDAPDLFLDLISRIRNETGLKVIVYMAGQGPALLKLTKHAINRAPYEPSDHPLRQAHDWDKTLVTSPARDRWLAYVVKEYDCEDPLADDFAIAKKAYAEKIVSYYAQKYGTAVDGWWFDQGWDTDPALLAAACHSGNPDAVFGVNRGPKVPLQVNNKNVEDYTCGHPTPIAKTKPSDPVNEQNVEAIEATPDGFLTDDGWDVLGHMFMPMGTSWNGLHRDRMHIEWTLEQAVDWKSRVLQAGGAWTWNLPREGPGHHPEMSLLRKDFVEFLNIVGDQLASSVCASTASEEPPGEQCEASPSEN